MGSAEFPAKGLEHLSYEWNQMQDFPGGPVVKNPPSNAEDGVQSLVGELRSRIPRGN